MMNLLKKYKEWKKNREINRWYNWHQVGHEWRVTHQSENHVYEELYHKFVNIFTGEVKYAAPYYSRKSRFRDPNKYRITLLKEQLSDE